MDHVIWYVIKNRCKLCIVVRVTDVFLIFMVYFLGFCTHWCRDRNELFYSVDNSL